MKKPLEKVVSLLIYIKLIANKGAATILLSLLPPNPLYYAKIAIYALLLLRLPYKLPLSLHYN